MFWRWALRWCVTSKLRLRNVGRVMIFMPYLIGGLLLGYIWQFILGDCMATLGEMTGHTDLFFLLAEQQAVRLHRA